MKKLSLLAVVLSFGYATVCASDTMENTKASGDMNTQKLAGPKIALPLPTAVVADPMPQACKTIDEYNNTTQACLDAVKAIFEKGTPVKAAQLPSAMVGRALHDNSQIGSSPSITASALLKEDAGISIMSPGYSKPEEYDNFAKKDIIALSKSLSEPKAPVVGIAEEKDGELIVTNKAYDNYVGVSTVRKNGTNIIVRTEWAYTRGNARGVDYKYYFKVVK